MAEFFEVEVDIDKAAKLLNIVKTFSSENKAELGKVEEAAKDMLYGFMLTGVQEGLFSNGSMVLSRVRDKIFMAFEAGYYYGRKRS
jgi:hypothetical protein